MTSMTSTIDILDDIQKAMNEIGELWPLLSDHNPEEAAQRKNLLAQRRVLQEQYDEIMDNALNIETEQLIEVVLKLREATAQAKEAKNSLDSVIEKIKKVSSAIEKITKAVDAVGSVLV